MLRRRHTRSPRLSSILRCRILLLVQDHRHLRLFLPQTDIPLTAQNGVIPLLKISSRPPLAPVYFRTHSMSSRLGYEAARRASWIT